jgi:deoxycytidylate deaminase
MAETAMSHADGAARRSACLSRQVGAALVDARGGLVSTGANEVPRAGGGVYGERPDERKTIAARSGKRDDTAATRASKIRLLMSLSMKFPNLRD